MCGPSGGGGGQDPNYYTNIENDRINAENARADAAQAAADKAAADQRTKFTTDLSDAVMKGTTNAAQYLTDRGLPADPTTIDHIIQSIHDQVPDLDPNPAKYFTDTAIGTGLDTAAQATRDKANNQIQSTFAPGFENTLIPDSAATPIEQTILGEQRTNAQKIVDFNKARGLLNDQGYSAAESALDRQGSAGLTTLNSIGQSVLGTDRSDLTNIRGQAGDAATGFQYGMTAPDISGYYQKAQDKATSDLSNIEGSIRGAVGSTNLFDAPSALQLGGTMQGPINLTTAGGVGAPPTAINPLDPNNKNNLGRGLGSTGVF